MLGIRRTVALLLGLAALAALGACRDITAVTKSATPVAVITASGTHRALDGVWLACYAGAPDTASGWNITGNSATLISYSFASTGGVCNTGQSVVWTVNGTFYNPTDRPMSGWTSGVAVAPAPTLLSGTGVLVDPPTATFLDVSVNFTSGAGAPPLGSYPGKFAWLMDDTGLPWRIYQDFGAPSPPCGPFAGTNADGSCLHTADYLIKQ